nr:MlaD family protein [Nocardia higoensis]
MGGPIGRLLEQPARVVVGAVAAGVRHRLGLSAAALAVTLVLSTGYLVFGALGVDPAAQRYTVRVHLADSGGLLPGQNVTLRGVPVGRVEALELAPGGLVAVAGIAAEYRIPAGGTVRVSGLSPAGEQYLDFRPDSDDGPFLADGAVVTQDDTATPVPFYQVLGDLDAMLAQVDPDRLAAVVAELGVGPEGPRKLTEIIDGGVFLLATLDGVLPQTMSLLRDSRTVLTELGALAPGLGEAARSAEIVMRDVEAADGGLRTLLDTGPGALEALDAMIADNSPTMVQLLGNLATVSRLAYVRIPALQEFFFPTFRDGSTLAAISTVFHDGGLWGLVNIYPRYACDYRHQRGVPTQPDFPEPYLSTYCENDDPSVLIRGARNAPRPPGDDTAGPPPGAAPDARSSPSPIGEQTIPLPFGGPFLSGN